MSKAFLLLSLLLMIGAEPAVATVTDTTGNGFTSYHEKTIRISPENVYQYFVEDIGLWWDSDHTYSGNAANLSIDPKAGGLFLEKLGKGGTIRHMTVIYAQPGKMLRMEGGLGPLQQFPVNGVMTLTILEKQGETKVTLTYNVGGYVTGGVSKLAGIVDQVIGQQFDRFVKFCNEKAR